MLPEEPYLGPFEGYTATEVRRLLETKSTTTAPLFIAIDGRSAGGKSTVAKVLSDRFEAAGQVVALLHTDDFAWWHSYFDWDQMLLENAIEPLKRNQAVDFTPPAWPEHGRAGSITTPQNASVVIIEGVGIARENLAPHFDWVIWVQSDFELAHQRGVLRDLSERPDLVEAERFWQEWQAEEKPFLANSKPWQRADLVFLGTPPDKLQLWVARVK
ncbi:MAG: uridine kinase [Micrococcales bacterium]